MSFKFINGGLIFSLLTLLFTSCGGDDGDSSGATAPTTNITAADPYVTGAVFYWDQNENFVPDPNEPLSTTTDENGKASFSQLLPQGAIIRQKISGLSGGIPYPGGLGAKIDSNVDPASVVVSPLTTLLTGCYTADELASAIASATGVTFTDEELYSDPMSFKDQSLLQANLSAANSIWSQMTELQCPTSTSSRKSLNKTTMETEFQKNFEIYESVLSAYGTNKQLVAKKGATFSNYILKYTNSDLLDPAILASATEAVDMALNGDASLFTPVILSKSGSDHIAKKLDRSFWLPTDDYMGISMHPLNYKQRDMKGTVGNYPYTPFEIELSFLIFKNSQETGINFENYTEDLENFTETLSGYFDAKAKTFNITEKQVNKDGKKPLDHSTFWELPVYTVNYDSTQIWRTVTEKVSDGIATSTIYTVFGEGVETKTYYGIDADPTNPSNTDLWITNYNRTNNCITTDTYGTPLNLDYSCNGVTGQTYRKFVAAAEKADLHSISAMVGSGNMGSSGLNPPKTMTLKFGSPSCYSELAASPTYDSNPPCLESGPTTEALTINQSTPNLEISFRQTENYTRFFKVGGRSETDASYPDFSMGFPECAVEAGTPCYLTPLKVHGIDSIQLNGQVLNVSGKSGFFRDGILFLDLREIPNSNWDIIILHVMNRTGFAIPRYVVDQNQSQRILMVNGVSISTFQYKGISEVTIESLEWQ